MKDAARCRGRLRVAHNKDLASLKQRSSTVQETDWIGWLQPKPEAPGNAFIGRGGTVQRGAAAGVGLGALNASSRLIDPSSGRQRSVHRNLDRMHALTPSFPPSTPGARIEDGPFPTFAKAIDCPPRRLLDFSITRRPGPADHELKASPPRDSRPVSVTCCLLTVILSAYQQPVYEIHPNSRNTPS